MIKRPNQCPLRTAVTNPFQGVSAFVCPIVVRLLNQKALQLFQLFVTLISVLQETLFKTSEVLRLPNPILLPSVHKKTRMQHATVT